MATKTDVTTIARNYLRDFPRFFQTAFAPSGRTYDLAKPNIDADTLWVAYVPTAGGSSVTVLTDAEYSLDSRNGLLRFATALPADNILVEGYHYEWLTPADLDFYADMALHLNMHNLDVALENLAPAVVDVIGIATLVQALWGLLSEYSRDIDVIASESVHIVASQRYRMVQNLLEFWMNEYNTRAGALNIGLSRLEMVTLRRISYTTGRYVPLYKGREIGDFEPIERIFPPIDDGIIDLVEDPDERTVVYVDGEPPAGYMTTGGYYT